MSGQFKTEQEEFWAGQFGDEYIARNVDGVAGSNTALLARILARCPGAGSLIEFGANVGLNLRAIRALHPGMRLEAIEINSRAADELEVWGGADRVHRQSILDFQPERTWDIALTKGVLIHINPEYLPGVYDRLFRAAGQYIVVMEYYNPTPVEVTYRGHAGKLFKRDFAGDLLQRYAQLSVVDYGFAWRRDPVFPQDDLTWFVLRKSGPEQGRA